MADNKVNSGLLEFSEDQKVFVALDAETSEVKKAVTIDGDGVETDIQGVQPSGKKEITTTEEVNVANYATAQVVDEDLVAGNIKKDVDILGVVGSYEPAAPASDYSTAEVTITVTGTTPDLLIVIPGIFDGDLWGYVTQAGVYNVLVPNNKATIAGVFGQLITNVSATGDIVADSFDEIYINGAGTINIVCGSPNQ